VKPLTIPISLTTPFPRRVEEFSTQRGRLLETLSPVRRAAVLMEPFRPALAKRLKHARDLMRAAAIAAFAPELSKLAADDKHSTTAALDVMTSWVAWEQMRRHQGLSETDARRVMATTIRALLAK
jgi:hypothetical protein